MPKPARDEKRRICVVCGCPLTDEHPGRTWGVEQHRHADRDVCIAALGAVVHRHVNTKHARPQRLY